MKRVGLRNKIISSYWQRMPPEAIKRKLGCTPQTIAKWLKPLQGVAHENVPKTLLSLGWSAGELIRVLKIDEDILQRDYGITFKARGVKIITDEQLIEYLDNENIVFSNFINGF